MEQGAKEIIREQEERLKKEQGAKRDEKGALKIGQKEHAPKMEGSRENGAKCRREQGACRHPLTEPL